MMSVFKLDRLSDKQSELNLSIFKIEQYKIVKEELLEIETELSRRGIRYWERGRTDQDQTEQTTPVNHC